MYDYTDCSRLFLSIFKNSTVWLWIYDYISERLCMYNNHFMNFNFKKMRGKLRRYTGALHVLYYIFFVLFMNSYNYEFTITFSERFCIYDNHFMNCNFKKLEGRGCWRPFMCSTIYVRFPFLTVKTVPARFTSTEKKFTFLTHPQ